MTSLAAVTAGVVTVATGITIDASLAAVFTFCAALLAAYPSYRLLRANRRKVLLEASNVADQRVERAARLFMEDNQALRQTVARLEGKLESAEHRVDMLERCLIEHGLPLPT